uniref:EGF-like domain-containing protein n=1 Tax=Ditylenchus dipsaci TaxID=166011 RepID=A0A915CUA5_9BILA
MEKSRKDSTNYHQRIGPILVDQPLPNIKATWHIDFSREFMTAVYLPSGSGDGPRLSTYPPPSYPPPEDAPLNKVNQEEITPPNTTMQALFGGAEAPEYEDPDLDHFSKALSNLSHSRQYSTSRSDPRKQLSSANNPYYHCQNDYEVALSSRGSTKTTPYTRLASNREENSRLPSIIQQPGSATQNNFPASTAPISLLHKTQLVYSQKQQQQQPVDLTNSSVLRSNDSTNDCPARLRTTSWRNSSVSIMNRTTMGSEAGGSGFYFDPTEVDTSLLSCGNGGRRSCDNKSSIYHNNNTTTSSLMSSKHKMQHQPRGILFPPPPPLNASPLISTNMRKRKLSGSLTSTTFLPNLPRSVLFGLFLLLLLAFLAIVYFLVSQTGQPSYSYYNNENGGVLYGRDVKNISSTAALRSFQAGQSLLPLPTQVHLDNISMPIYRQEGLSTQPTPSSYDFQRIISADHLHLTGSKSRSARDLVDQNMVVKRALVSYFMLSGRWFLGFLNDDLKPQSIDLLASVTTPHSLNPMIASRLGNCHCHPGYSGKHCEETACPVLCSGNGVFSNGQCVCHEGFKGPECDLLDSWCALPNCNYHGRCSMRGQCICDSGWSGEFCDKPSCVDPTCSGHGICQDSHCYCVSGWWGESCEQSFDGSKMCAFASERKMGGAELLSFTVDQGSPTGNIEGDSTQKVRDVSNEVNSNSEGMRVPLWSCPAGCLNGVCVNGSCHCSAGWSGQDCSTTECIQGCDVHGHCEGMFVFVIEAGMGTTALLKVVCTTAAAMVSAPLCLTNGNASAMLNTTVRDVNSAKNLIVKMRWIMIMMA